MKLGKTCKLLALSVCPLLISLSTMQAQLAPSFFAMGATDSRDLPKVEYGVISHPPLAWTLIEGTGRGVFDFSSMDQYVNAAPKNASGVAQIDIAMGWTPGWAVSSKKGCVSHLGVEACTTPPDNLQDWTDFITAVANHYNGKTAPMVQYYEIWNEANTVSFWTGTVAQLIAMAQVAYPVLKQNGHSMVFTPSVAWSPNGTTWMSSYLSGGGNRIADGVSFHGYPSKTSKGATLPIPLPESLSSTNMAIQLMADSFRAVANANGMVTKPLITTEGGWGVKGVSDPDMQAAWIAQFEIVIAGEAASDGLLFQTWYTWGHASSGTIETTSGQPTEAGLAYNEVLTWLLGTSPSQCGSSSNIWSCAVGKNLIVWDASQTCSNGSCTTGPYNAPQGYTTYVDLTGAVHSISGTIVLGVKPIMMRP